MPDIMLIARSFPPVVGGIENYIYNIYSKLSSDVVIVAPFEQGYSVFDKEQDLKIFRTPRFLNFMNKEKMAIFPLFLSAVRVLLRHRIGQIHCDQVQSGIIAYLFKKLFGKPYLVYAYGMEITGGGFHWLKSIVLRNANKVITISNFTKRSLINRMKVSDSNIAIVHPGVDTIKFNPNLDYSHIINKYALKGKKVILTVGRLASKELYKGHDMVIEALPKISSQIPDIVYLIVGSGGDLERLEGLVQKLGLEEKVIFVGYIPDEELPLYYSACDLFIMPSRDKIEKDGRGKKVEGFGIVFLEANACGKPVIGGRSGGIEDAVIDGMTGLLIDPNNVDEIAKAIIRLLTDDALAQRLGKQGRNRVVNELSWEKIAAKVEEVVCNLR